MVKDIVTLLDRTCTERKQRFMCEKQTSTQR